MSTMRMRMRVEVDGTEYLVTTNARDLAAVEKYLDPNVDESDLMRTFRVAHAALLRTNAEKVPTDFDAFVDLVDNLDPLDDEGNTIGLPDPTSAAG